MRYIVGLVFADPERALLATRTLRDAGHDRDRVSMVMSDETRNASVTGDSVGHAVGWGAAAGALLGGLFAVATLGATPLWAGGPLAALLGGTMAGATGGTIIGAVTALGISEERAISIENLVRAGGVLVTAQAANEAEVAELSALLRSCAEERDGEPFTVEHMRTAGPI